jgi:hypothetical protein
MKSEDLKEQSAGRELEVRDEFRAVLPLFRYRVQVGNAEYLANNVQVEVTKSADSVYFDVTLTDAWVWDINLPVRTVSKVMIQSCFDSVITDDLRPA